MPGDLRVWLFGGFRAEVAGRVVPDGEWRRSGATALVKLLALRGRLHRDEAVDLLWPQADQALGVRRLNKSLHFARRVLGADRIALRDSMLVLTPAGLWTDVDAFATAARQGDAEAALALYTGDLLPENRFDDWSEPDRTQLRNAVVPLLLERSAHGEPHEAEAHLLRLVGLDPLHEEAYARLMRLEIARGRRHVALRWYDRLAAQLRDDLGVEPRDDVRRMHHNLTATAAPDAHSTAGTAFPAPSPTAHPGRVPIPEPSFRPSEPTATPAPHPGIRETDSIATRTPNPGDHPTGPTGTPSLDARPVGGIPVPSADPSDRPTVGIPVPAPEPGNDSSDGIPVPSAEPGNHPTVGIPIPAPDPGNRSTGPTAAPTPDSGIHSIDPAPTRTPRAHPTTIPSQGVHFTFMSAAPVPAQHAGPAAAAIHSAGMTTAPKSGPGIQHSDEERKLVTVLDADLRGVRGEVADADPERARREVAEWTDLLREVITRWGGAVQPLVGGGVIGVFGYPTAREDHADRALWAGSEILRRSPAPIRLGADTGQIIAASELSGIGGAVLDTAARLRAAAAPRTLLVTDRTRRAALRPEFHFGDRTPVGDPPVNAHQLLASPVFGAHPLAVPPQAVLPDAVPHGSRADIGGAEEAALPQAVLPDAVPHGSRADIGGAEEAALPILASGLASLNRLTDAFRTGSPGGPLNDQ
ncbi:BTAD domain-containing putative transcriptional regulator [Paractinoplanes hotanensis]|uniref:Guanylate cyclase domain-containing protein n=1 Tax=Paractinoplanes hotanensis TaxID=2906497 RepID=A0ABT0XQD2_9ACTN|nr:BTAD domain-containing putative transcriptional regulator [Actinoplanes hotanensis]MCM4075942.1 hypothetical protein [Actinoplanes hotanensis]